MFLKHNKDTNVYIDMKKNNSRIINHLSAINRDLVDISLHLSQSDSEFASCSFLDVVSRQNEDFKDIYLSLHGCIAQSLNAINLNIHSIEEANSVIDEIFIDISNINEYTLRYLSLNGYSVVALSPQQLQEISDSLNGHYIIQNITNLLNIISEKNNHFNNSINQSNKLNTNNLAKVLLCN